MGPDQEVVDLPDVTANERARDWAAHARALAIDVVSQLLRRGAEIAGRLDLVDDARLERRMRTPSRSTATRWWWWMVIGNPPAGSAVQRSSQVSLLRVLATTGA